MKRQTNWSPTERVLFTSLGPVAALVGALILFSFVRSLPESAPRSEPSAGLAARSSPGEARRTERDAFRDCLRGMGADMSRTRARSRFSARPDMKKIQEAMSFCRTLLESDGDAPQKPRAPTAPPIA